jgi:hypothetical protein
MQEERVLTRMKLGIAAISAQSKGFHPSHLFHGVLSMSEP